MPSRPTAYHLQSIMGVKSLDTCACIG